MNNNKTNTKRWGESADGLGFVQPEDIIFSKESVEQTDAEIMCALPRQKGTLKSILQRCRGMFVKDEVLQEKKRKLSNFIKEN